MTAADSVSGAPATAAGDRPAVLEVSGLSKNFGAHPVLRDVSLKVHKGATVCLLGPSGSGKSTLLRCMNWLEEPDGGSVVLNGQRIGMVFQHFALWPKKRRRRSPPLPPPRPATNSIGINRDRRESGKRRRCGRAR
jgi:ABC-type glutathione transport system ATPase component